MRELTNAQLDAEVVELDTRRNQACAVQQYQAEH